MKKLLLVFVFLLRGCSEISEKEKAFYAFEETQIDAYYGLSYLEIREIENEKQYSCFSYRSDRNSSFEPIHPSCSFGYLCVDDEQQCTVVSNK